MNWMEAGLSRFNILKLPGRNQLLESVWFEEIRINSAAGSKQQCPHREGEVSMHDKPSHGGRTFSKQS